MNVGCPNCGGPVEFRAGSSICVVCPSCRSAVVRAGLDASQLKLVGKVAQLALTDHAMSIGTRGVYEGRAFTVLGRIQLDFGQGVWDEFYAVFVDVQGLETWGWIAEAQGQLLVTFAERAPAISYDAIQVPMTITIGNRSFVAQERGIGHFVAAEGELPTEIELGQNFGYVDLSGAGGWFATLDYGHGNRALPEIAYVGRSVTHESLGLPPPTQVAREAAMRAAQPAEGTKLACPKCGAPIEIRAPSETKQVVCGHCNSLLDASHGALAWLSVLKQLSTTPKIPIGTEGKLDALLGEATVAGNPPASWKVIGFMTRKCNVEGSDYFWDEYLLYASTRGFRYLTEQNGHWSVVVPVEVGNVDNERDDVAVYQGDRFQMFCVVHAIVARVLGEFPGLVAIGEHARDD
ncbi:MAG: DUF4178 domain-containing protein, partial [Polyangiales bacterium]